jgi:hypothetical protein
MGEEISGGGLSEKYEATQCQCGRRGVKIADAITVTYLAKNGEETGNNGELHDGRS